MARPAGSASEAEKTGCSEVVFVCTKMFLFVVLFYNYLILNVHVATFL